MKYAYLSREIILMKVVKLRSYREREATSAMTAAASMANVLTETEAAPDNGPGPGGPGGGEMLHEYLVEKVVPVGPATH